MNILALDTVTEMCSVALLSDQQSLNKEQHVPRRHTLVILNMIKTLLAEAQITFSELDAVSFSRGPGSFTGLRICASVTQGLALAHDLPVIPLSSLAVLAQGAYRLDARESILACLDARKSEVYWACYQVKHGRVNRLGDEHVSPPSGINLGNAKWHGVGNGFLTYTAELNSDVLVNLESTESERYPLAQDMLVLAQAAWENRQYVDVSLAIPTYLRDNVAKPKK